MVFGASARRNNHPTQNTSTTMYTIRRYIFYPLYRIYAKLASRLQPRRAVPPIPCQYCGQPGHTERFCPKAKGMGFRWWPSTDHSYRFSDAEIGYFSLLIRAQTLLK